MAFDLKVTIDASLAKGTLGYLKKLVGEFGSITANKFTGMFAAAAVAKMAFDKVTEAMEKNMQQAKQISSLSAKFHIDPKEVHSLLLAANDAGVSVRSLLMGMKSLGNLGSKALVDKNAMAVFKNLGVDVEKVGEVAEKPAKQFAEIARLLMSIDNETDRTAYGTKLLGRQYQQMIPLIEKLGTSAEARANFLDNENAMTKEQVEQMKATAKMQSEMEEAWNNIVAALAPYILQLTASVNLLFQGIKYYQKMIELVGALSDEEKKRQLDVEKMEKDKYDKERSEYLAARERVKEAHIKLKGKDLKVGEKLGPGYGQIAGFYGAGTDSKGRQTVGLPADLRAMEAFEAKYADKTTTFYMNGGVFEPSWKQKGGPMEDAEDGPTMLPETSTQMSIRRQKERIDQLTKQAMDDSVYMAGLRGRAVLSNPMTTAFTAGALAPSVFVGAAAGFMGDKIRMAADGINYEEQIKLAQDRLKSLEETGELEAAAAELEKERLKNIEEERRAKVKYMETFLKSMGMDQTHYIDKNGNIVAGRKPEEGMLRPIEDVDSEKKASDDKKRRRALERKLHREQRDVGLLEGAEDEVDLTKKEQAEHLKEEYEPKKKKYEDSKKAMEQKMKERDEFLEKHGVLVKDADGKEHREIAKSSRYAAEYKGLASAYESSKGQFEQTKKEFEKEEGVRVDMANAVFKAERELWRAKKAEEDYGLKDLEDKERALHERKTKMMEAEGKTKKEILEENFKFEVAKLEDAMTQYDQLKDEYEADGVITADEEKALRAAKEKIDAQSGKAEASMFALANADKPWQIASDMRAIGGGGKIIGTSADTAIEQLETLKANLPASKEYLAQIAAALGAGQKGSKNVTTRTSSTYATTKGSIEAKPGSPDFHGDMSD